MRLHHSLKPLSRRARALIVPRTYVLTGSASGIGAATRDILERGGARVIGVDVRDAEVIADLSTEEGRAEMLFGVAAEGSAIDAVIACAGVPGGRDDSDVEKIVRVNYFGAHATLDGLRPLLARGESPRAAVVSSKALLLGVNESIVDACLAGDEDAALAAREPDSQTAYRSTKRAIARWVRRVAPSPDWAGAGIALNAVAPGVISTPMTAAWLDRPDARAELIEAFPQPLAVGGIGSPEQVGQVLVWLTSPENSLVTGQVIHVDGGHEALTRGDDWL